MIWKIYDYSSLININKNGWLTMIGMGKNEAFRRGQKKNEEEYWIKNGRSGKIFKNEENIGKRNKKERFKREGKSTEHNRIRWIN